MKCPVCRAPEVSEDVDRCPFCDVDLGPLRRIQRLPLELRERAERAADSGDVETAAGLLEASAALGDDQAESAAALGKLLVARGRRERGEEALQKAAALGYEDDDTRALLARCRWARRRRRLWIAAAVLGAVLCLGAAAGLAAHYGRTGAAADERAAAAQAQTAAAQAQVTAAKAQVTRSAAELQRSQEAQAESATVQSSLQTRVSQAEEVSRALQAELAEQVAAQERAKAANQARLERVTQAAQAAGLRVSTELQDGVLLLVPTRGLFDSGHAEPTAAGTEDLRALAGFLAANTEGLSIQIEGHTDSAPIVRGKGPADNWQLGVERAGWVAALMGQMQEGLKQHLTISSAGESSALYVNLSPSDRSLNRTVFFLLRVAD